MSQDQVETPSLQPQFSLFLPASWGGFNLSRDSVLWGYHISSTCVMSHPQVSFSPRLEDVSIKDYLRRDSVLWEYFINMCRCLSQASPSEVKNLTPPPLKMLALSTSVRGIGQDLFKTLSSFTTFPRFPFLEKKILPSICCHVDMIFQAVKYCLKALYIKLWLGSLRPNLKNLSCT